MGQRRRRWVLPPYLGVHCAPLRQYRAVWIVLITRTPGRAVVFTIRRAAGQGGRWYKANQVELSSDSEDADKGTATCDTCCDLDQIKAANGKAPQCFRHAALGNWSGPVTPTSQGGKSIVAKDVWCKVECCGGWEEGGNQHVTYGFLGGYQCGGETGWTQPASS